VVKILNKKGDELFSGKNLHRRTDTKIGFTGKFHEYDYPDSFQTRSD
jgi:hypothetical protein